MMRFDPTFSPFAWVFLILLVFLFCRFWPNGRNQDAPHAGLAANYWGVRTLSDGMAMRRRHARSLCREREWKRNHPP